MSRITPPSRPISEIAPDTPASGDFLEKNQKLLIVVAIILAIIAAGIVIKRNFDIANNETAGEALSEAKDIEAIESTIKEYPKTPAAVTAAVELSDLQWEQGQQSAAIDTLEELIAKHPKHPAIISAQARLASRLKEQGEDEKAKSIFNAILEDPENQWIAPYAMASLADISAKAGDKEAAEKLLDQALKEYPFNSFQSTVQQARRFLNFEAPVEIEAPKESEAPLSNSETKEEVVNPSLEADPSNPLLDTLLNSESQDTEAPSSEE